MLWVYVTCGSSKEAKAIAEKLVKERLAACGVVIENASSFYFWKKKFVRNKEAILILKASEKNYSRLEKRVKQLHSYEVPCIIALKPWSAFKKYVEWVEQNTK